MKLIKPVIMRISIALFCVFLACCHNPDDKNKSSNKDTVNIQPEANGKIKIQRFDQDILALEKDSSLNSLHQLRKKYGTFLDTIFCKQIMRLWTAKDENLVRNLKDFLTDVDIKRIYGLVNARFKNVDDIEKGFNDAFDQYRKLFPGKVIPRVYTMVNALNYSAIAADSLIAVGLDLFLGSDCDMYPALQFPIYKTRKLRREYIVRDAMEEWIKSDYDDSKVKKDLISQMIYNGKILYALDLILPNADDTLKMGFTKNQLDWCNLSEGSIWTFFIEKKLLFSTDELTYARFINDGPTTQGMPKESPANVGCWVGWQIVRKYMKEHPEINLKQLLEDNDSRKILEGAKYKPAVS